MASVAAFGSSWIWRLFSKLWSSLEKRGQTNAPGEKQAYFMIDRSLPKGGSAWPRQNIQLDISGLKEQMDDVDYIHLLRTLCAVIYISVSTDSSTSCTCHNFLRFTAGYD